VTETAAAEPAVIAQSAAAPALILRALSKEYVRGQPVLRGIDLAFAPRGITAIIGPSGTGKSTLIRCINRLVEPSAGQVIF
jgi:phosphonate transport system ATP-binding protein